MNIDITHAELKLLLIRAFDKGGSLSTVFREECIEELLAHKDRVIAEELRVWTVEELRQQEVKTRFYHPELGDGIVIGGKCMAFRGNYVYGFMTDEYPWDIPMLRDTPC